MTEESNENNGLDQLEEVEAIDVQNDSIEIGELFEETLTDIREREGLTDKERRALEKTVRRLEADYKMDGNLAIRVDTKKEIDTLRTVLDEAMEETMEEGSFNVRDNVDDVGDIFDTTIRREQAEDRINELGFEGLEGFEGVETVDDLAALSVEQLMSLEAKHEGILFYAFTDFVGRDKKIDLEHFEEFYKTPKAGEKIQIDFRGNPEAEAAIGAAELFPPSIRRITVYANGDKQRSRTSKVRVGLKGRNNSNEGFFDGQGYMPIYTSDVVVIGGENQSRQGIDQDFEARFRKEDGTLDYDAYENSA